MKGVRAGRPAGGPRRSGGSPDRRGVAGEAGNQAMQQALAGRGAGLDPASRSSAEAQLGLGLGHVRVHRGADAEGAARGLNARAFTAGDNIVLGGAADRRSLAHELIHVAQGARNGVRSADGGAAAEREAARLAPALAAGGAVRPAAALGPGIHREDLTCGPEEAVEAAEEAVEPPFDLTSQTCELDEPSFRAEDVDVAALTNEMLNAEALRVDDWLRGYGLGGDPDTPEYWTLARRLRKERQRRVKAGHVWLATVEPASPGRLIGLKTEGTRQHIILVDLAKAMGPPEMPGGLMIMTETQFHASLAARNATITDEQGYLAWLAEQEQAQKQNQLVSSDPQAGLAAPEGSVLPFGATGETTAWGDENIVGAPADYGRATAALATRGLYMSPTDYYIGRQFSAPARATTGGNIQTWIGNMAEESYRGGRGAGYGLFTDVLNARPWTDFVGSPTQPAPIPHPASQHAYPSFDFSRRQGELGADLLGVQRIQVKTSARNQNGRFAYYREGLAEMLDARGTAFQHYLRNQEGLSGVAKPPAGGSSPAYEAARTAIIQDAYLAVNADDVLAFKASLQDTQSNWRHALFAAIYNAELREGAVTIQTSSGPRTFDSVAQINGATGLTPQEIAQAKAMVGARVARRVVSSGITTEQVIRLRAARNAAPGTMSVGEVGDWATPAYIGGLRAGQTWRGQARVAGAAGLRAGGSGTVISLVTTAGVMVFDEADHPDWAAELGRSAGTGLVSNAVTGMIEQPLLAAGGRYGLSAGASRWIRPGMLKMGAGAGAGGAGAVVGEWLSMGYFEDRPHSAEEIVTRTVRSGGIGAASYAVGTGATIATTSTIAVIFGPAALTAAEGSILPGWGTAAGFIVGLGAGLYAYYKLEQNVPGGGESWEADEAQREQQRAEHQARLEAARAPYLRQMAAEKSLIGAGTPYAAAVDDDAIPAGYGIRQSEQEPEMSLQP